LKFNLINILIVVVLVLLSMMSCEDDGIIKNEDAELVFSTDTLLFDTVFTTLGTATYSFKVYNQYLQSINISSIKLAGGEKSPYRLNIDGEMTNELTNLKISPGDSIFIFVELTVDPNGGNQPMIVQDSVIFVTNSNLQDVDLVAWGQDFIPIDGEVITTETWTAEKPYLIYNYAYVDSGEVLTIEPGTRIHMHKGAQFVAVGSIEAIGTPEKPIVFEGDRLEDMYFDIPDQWFRLLILSSETPSVFEHVEIYNSNLGLQLFGDMETGERANAILRNVKISHMGQTGIYSVYSNIDASNVEISDCGLCCLLVQAGGAYNFNHCTFANYWGNYSVRQNPSVVVSNKFYNPNEDIEYIANLDFANFTNSIIWGNSSSEVLTIKHPDVAFNCLFDNSLVKLSDSLNKAEPDIFKTAIVNKDPLFVDPYPEIYNFELDSLSPAKNIGLRKYAELIPFDFKQVSRLNDKAPDLGAYEWIAKEKNEK